MYKCNCMANSSVKKLSTNEKPRSELLTNQKSQTFCDWEQKWRRGEEFCVVAVWCLIIYVMIANWIDIDWVKVRGHSFLQLLFTFNCSDSEQKMEGELASLMEVYHLVKKAGRSATLTFSSKRGSASTVKLEIELDNAAPPSASTSSLPSTPVAPAPGSQRRQRRSKAKKAKANARAALHQPVQAAPTSACRLPGHTTIL